MIRRFANALLSALLAPPCAVCGRVLDDPLDGAVCPSCWDSIALAGEPAFAVCPSVARGCAVGPYEGQLRAIIHALKYDGRRSVAPRLAALMATHGRGVLDGADLVIPVPLHRRRQRERGFNQADDLARGLGLPLLRVLRRVTHTRPQVDLLAADRHSNVAGAFAVHAPGRARTLALPVQLFRGGRGRDVEGSGWRGPRRSSRVMAAFDPAIAGKVVVLVDDVTTTGATLEACARVLRGAGAREVRALTAARVVTARR